MSVHRVVPNDATHPSSAERLSHCLCLKCGVEDSNTTQQPILISISTSDDDSDRVSIVRTTRLTCDLIGVASCGPTSAKMYEIP